MSFCRAAAWPLVLAACSGCRSSETDQTQASPSTVLPGGRAAIAAPQATATGGGGRSPADAANAAVGGGGSSKTVGTGGAAQHSTATAGAATPTKIKPTNGGGELIHDCRPCEVTISESLPSYSVRFEIDATDQGRAARALHLSRADRPGWSQKLIVHDMQPIASHEEFIFGATDINFDDRADLLFSTRRGTSNVYADYWLFVHKSEEFEYLGDYPTFRLDPKSHTLSTYESGGAAGLIYESNQYRFIGGKLTVIKQEKQEETDEFGVFMKIISRLDNGTLREVSRQRVVAPPAKD